VIDMAINPRDRGEFAASMGVGHSSSAPRPPVVYSPPMPEVQPDDVFKLKNNILNNFYRLMAGGSEAQCRVQVNMALSTHSKSRTFPVEKLVLQNILRQPYYSSIHLLIFL